MKIPRQTQILDKNFLLLGFCESQFVISQYCSIQFLL